MTFAVGDACVDVLDKSCIGVCPVDCIYVGGRKTYIHPVSCIDCGACLSACPVDAITSESSPAEEHTANVKANAAFFKELLPGQENPLGRPAAAWEIGPLTVDTERIRALPPRGRALEKRVRDYCSGVLADCDSDRIRSLRRFEQGQRHDVFTVAYLDHTGTTKNVVVRIASFDEPADRVQTEREAHVLTSAQGLAVPRLLDVSLESPWFDAPVMCMEFVPGEQRELAQASRVEFEQLGGAVAAIHRLPTEEAEPATLEAYAAQRLASMHPPDCGELTDRVTAAWNRLQQRPFSGRGPLVLLHGDVSGGNIIWAPQPVLIDWEYTRLGDPADEIAYLFSQNGLTEPQRRAFWRGYGPGQDVLDRVPWWEPVTLLGSALWWIERSRHGPEPAGFYLKRAVELLDRLDAGLAA